MVWHGIKKVLTHGFELEEQGEFFFNFVGMSVPTPVVRHVVNLSQNSSHQCLWALYSMLEQT